MIRFHCDVLQLRDCDYFVSEKGRQRVIREKKKSVHAYIIGYLCKKGEILQAENEFLQDDDECCKYSVAYYNPYVTDAFIDKDTKIPISHSDYCDLDIHSQDAKVIAIWLQHSQKD